MNRSRPAYVLHRGNLSAPVLPVHATEPLEDLEARVAQNRADTDAIEALAQEKISVLDRVADKCDANWEMIEMLQADGLKLHDHDEQMEQALQSSRQIGAAVGIIMATRNVSEKEAFQSLVAASQRTNTKLKSIAGRVPLWRWRCRR